MWICTILLKDPFASKKFISISWSYRKYVFHVAIMINSSSIRDHRWCATFGGGGGTQPNVSFSRRNFVSAWYHLTLIVISMVDCPHTFIFKIIGIINVKTSIFSLKTEFLRCLLFGNLFEASLQTVSVWSSESDGSIVFLRGLSPKLIFNIRLILVAEMPSSLESCRADAFCFRLKRFLTFCIFSLVSWLFVD